MADHLDPTRTVDSPDHAVTRAIARDLGHLHDPPVRDTVYPRRGNRPRGNGRRLSGHRDRLRPQLVRRDGRGTKNNPWCDRLENEDDEYHDRGELPPLKPLEPLRW